MSLSASGTTVTIILPTLNERAHLRDCLDSLARQDCTQIVEILVVDGGSTDGTREIAEGTPSPVVLVPNPRITAAAAMNIGIEAARGDIVVRADAHTIYAPDYVRRCVEVLVETGADNVGGRMCPVGTTSFGRAVAAVTASPLGIGPGKFHYYGERTDVDTVYLGCWWTAKLRELGGYDERDLQWAAEDQELNFRIRRDGGRIVLDPSIRSSYFPRETVRALWRQYFNYGVAKASTLKKHRQLPSPRPLAPAALVAASVVMGAMGRRPALRLALPILHSVAVATAALSISEDAGVAPHEAAIALGTCHWSYGLGFWSGVGRIARGKPFDSRPRSHR